MEEMMIYDENTGLWYERLHLSSKSRHRKIV